MVRLPNAKDPESQSLFRRVREQLPKFFSAEEHIRYIRALHSLYRQALVVASNHGPGDAHCSNEYCSDLDRRPHGSEQFYEEIAEAWIGRVFMWADRPEKLKEQFIKFLKHYDHVVEARLNPEPLGEAVELFIEREARERRRQQHT